MKVYSGIEGIKLQDVPFSAGFKAMEKAETDYIEALRQKALRANKGKYVGKELPLPYADGEARYLVYSEKPMQLIHLAVGDAWDSPVVRHLTAKGVKEMIDLD